MVKGRFITGDEWSRKGRNTSRSDALLRNGVAQTCAEWRNTVCMQAIFMNRIERECRELCKKIVL